MSKRFTDTTKYKKKFIRGLQGPYKLLWDYLYHDCDHSGIWIVDFEVTQIYLGSDMPVNEVDALKYFNTNEQRIVVLDKGTKWFIPSFVEFQYGHLNSDNRVHNSVISSLEKAGISKALINSLKGVTDKNKVMDKDKATAITNTAPYEEIISYLNEATGKKFQDSTKKYRDLIKARFSEGFGIEDFKKVISIKTQQWLDNQKMNGYLRPDTLFSTKFQAYLNESGNQSGQGHACDTAGRRLDYVE